MNYTKNIDNINIGHFRHINCKLCSNRRVCFKWGFPCWEVMTQNSMVERENCSVLLRPVHSFILDLKSEIIIEVIVKVLRKK